MYCDTRNVIAVLGMFFFLCLSSLYAEQFREPDEIITVMDSSSRRARITKKELGFNYRGEYNRTFASSGDFSFTGALELNDKYAFKTGFALGNIGYATEIKLINSGQMAVFSKVPLYVKLAYMYYGLPQPYSYHAHSILPTVALNYRWAGLTLGHNFRISNFFGEKAFFEPALAFLGYVNFFNNDKLRVGLSCANFSEFNMGNLAAYSFKLSSDIHITEQWTVVFALELLQSGADGLTSTFYGISYRGGVRFAW